MAELGLPLGEGVELWAAWTARQVELQAWIKDLRFRFLAVNRPLARSCGARPDNMIGRTEVGFFSPELVRQFRQDDLRVIALNQPAVVEEFGPGGRFATLKRPLRDGRGRVVATLGIAYAWPPERPLPTVPPDLHWSRAAAPAWLQGVRDRMEHEFRAPLRVRRVAEEVGRHPNSLSRAFRWYFGVSVVEWLHRLRVAWVGELLLSEALPLSVVALRAGFADQAHLTRVFKRYYGLTPGQYRKASSLSQ
jgi:AraC-like DNA-binding protein